MANTPKIALITGASSGIGKATAFAFVKAGFITYGAARRVEAMQDLRQAGCKIIPLDVTDEASRISAIETIINETGRIDVLINNAGYALPPGPLEELLLAEIEKQYDTNVFGLLRMCQLVVPYMRKANKGIIVNISSMGGEFTTPFLGPYHSTKYAVESLSDALRFELRPFGIQVVVLQPAAVRTPLIAAALDTTRVKSGSPYEKMLSSFIHSNEVMVNKGQGVIEPEQVASVILRSALGKHPKSRYKVGLLAGMLPFLRRTLSDRLWDAMLRMQIK